MTFTTPFHRISLKLPRTQRFSNNTEHFRCFHFLLTFSLLNSSEDHFHSQSIAYLTVQVPVPQLFSLPILATHCLLQHGSTNDFKFHFTHFISSLKFLVPDRRLELSHPQLEGPRGCLLKIQSTSS